MHVYMIESCVIRVRMHAHVRAVPYCNSQFARAFTFKFPLFALRIVVVHPRLGIPLDEEETIVLTARERGDSPTVIVHRAYEGQKDACVYLHMKDTFRNPLTIPRRSFIRSFGRTKRQSRRVNSRHDNSQPIAIRTLDIWFEFPFPFSSSILVSIIIPSGASTDVANPLFLVLYVIPCWEYSCEIITFFRTLVTSIRDITNARFYSLTMFVTLIIIYNLEIRRFLRKWNCWILIMKYRIYNRARARDILLLHIQPRLPLQLRRYASRSYVRGTYNCWRVDIINS